jgi:hypothetical protein
LNLPKISMGREENESNRRGHYELLALMMPLS